jgi:hypothetical protein
MRSSFPNSPLPPQQLKPLLSKARTAGSGLFLRGCAGSPRAMAKPGHAYLFRHAFNAQMEWTTESYT